LRFWLRMSSVTRIVPIGFDFGDCLPDLIGKLLGGLFLLPRVGVVTISPSPVITTEIEAAMAKNMSACPIFVSLEQLCVAQNICGRSLKD
jgi:hypothetical protein